MQVGLLAVVGNVFLGFRARLEFFCDVYFHFLFVIAVKIIVSHVHLKKSLPVELASNEGFRFVGDCEFEV
jgi:hypothetical protein